VIIPGVTVHTVFDYTRLREGIVAGGRITKEECVWREEYPGDSDQEKECATHVTSAGPTFSSRAVHRWDQGCSSGRVSENYGAGTGKVRRAEARGMKGRERGGVKV